MKQFIEHSDVVQNDLANWTCRGKDPGSAFSFSPIACNSEALRPTDKAMRVMAIQEAAHPRRRRCNHFSYHRGTGAAFLSFLAALGLARVLRPGD